MTNKFKTIYTYSVKPEVPDFCFKVRKDEISTGLLKNITLDSIKRGIVNDTMDLHMYSENPDITENDFMNIVISFLEQEKINYINNINKEINEAKEHIVSLDKDIVQDDVSSDIER